MTDKEKLLAAAALAVAIVVGGVVAVIPNAETKVDDLKKAGVSLDFKVYAKVDQKTGAKTYVAEVPDGDGTKVVKLDRSPCARRPTGVKHSECLYLLPDAGTLDQSDEMVMQAGWFTGPGCVQTACAIMAGQAPEK